LSRDPGRTRADGAATVAARSRLRRLPAHAVPDVLALAFGASAVLDPRMADETPTILGAARAALDAALEAGRRLLDGGRAIDEHQVHAERLAYAATEVAAAEALGAYARERPDALVARMVAAFAGEAAARLRAQVEAHPEDFGLSDATLARTLGAPAVVAAVRAAQHESRWREIGRE